MLLCEHLTTDHSQEVTFFLEMCLGPFRILQIAFPWFVNFGSFEAYMLQIPWFNS